MSVFKNEPCVQSCTVIHGSFLEPVTVTRVCADAPTLCDLDRALRKKCGLVISLGLVAQSMVALVLGEEAPIERFVLLVVLSER